MGPDIAMRFEFMSMPKDATLLMEKFHKISRSERLERVKEMAGLTATEVATLSGALPLAPEIAENLIENVIGYFPVPFGVATYFNIDNRDVLIPMVVEESSIIAAASATAKWVRQTGTIKTSSKGKLIIGQIQIPRASNPKKSAESLLVHRSELIELCNSFLPGLVARGGGVKDIIVREIARSDGSGQMLVVHILCDPCDAMGANLINQVCESVKPRVAEIADEPVGLCILSNLVDNKIAIAEVVIKNIDPIIGLGIQEAALFAKSDPYRAATHNKGILNGIDPILIATGNDWRAVEAGIHAFASMSGSYQPVSDWLFDGHDLKGRIEVPMAVGVVGGVTRLHPMAKISLKMLGVNTADELGRICAAVGLVQNLGALKALSTVGIVKGHMNLHTTNLAFAAGADLHEIGEVSRRLCEVLKVERHVSLTRAREILETLRFAGAT
jgi:hydroxymethylglutaryl-CoA reductase